MNLKIVLSVLTVAFSSFATTDCRAALVFTANNQTNANLVFSDAFPSVDLSIAVFESEMNSGGIFLDRFAFRIELEDSTVATIDSVALSSPGNLTSQIAMTGGASAEAAGIYVVRPNHSLAPVAMATFTITGLKSGTTGIKILERTVGNDDFQNFAGGQLISQDSTVFLVDNGAGNLRGSINLVNFAGALTAVPEPSSLSFVLLGGVIAFRRRVR